VTAPYQVEDVEELLGVMEQWNIAEMHLTIGDASLDLVRTVAPAAIASPAAPAPAQPAATVATMETEPVIIQAPVVGVFHLGHRGFPQGAPHVGDAVQAGQVIGSIELMHVPTDLVSPVSGIITGILAEDGTGVEYARPLMSIRPFEEVSEDEAGMLPPPR